MGVLNSELDYDVILKDLSECCLGESSCGICKKEECLVGYAKKSITNCFKENVTYVESGAENIPNFDTKIYKEEQFIKGIAHILRQCKSCKENHYDNCIINILRNCYEVALFGEVQSYGGSAFRYLNQIHNSHPEEAAQIIETFHNSEE